MAKRPSFQFYPADWQNNAKLKRCSRAARSIWVDILCLLHDEDEYGILRWPLKEIAAASNSPMKFVQELVDKNVLKGNDVRLDTPYIYEPRSARKIGPPVTLIDVQEGPIWFSSRFVRDEYKRKHSGGDTRFVEGGKPPLPAPSPPLGEGQGDGSTPSTTSSINNTHTQTPAETNNSNLNNAPGGPQTDVWNTYPTYDQVPDPPQDVISAIAEVQYRTYSKQVSDNEVIEYWRTWRVTEIAGDKFYASKAEVYRYFSNHCKLRAISKGSGKQSTANNNQPSQGIKSNRKAL